MAWWMALAVALAAGGDEVVARVDGRPVTAADVAARQRFFRAQGQESGAPEILAALVDESVLCGEAERRGLARKPELASQIEGARRRLAADRFVQKEIVEPYRPDEAVLRGMFHANADSAHVRLAVFPSKEQAQAALERLLKGGKFAEEAKASLDEGSRSRGGDLGTVSRRELPAEIAEEAFKVAVGAPAGPVPYGLGWAVLQVASRRVGTDQEFAARRPDIEAFARDQARVQLPRHTAMQLRKKHGVGLDEAFIDKTGFKASAEPAEAQHVLARVGKSALRYGDLLQDLERISRGQQSPHMSGASVKKELAWKHVDQLLMEEEALGRGFGEDPEVKARLAADRCVILGTAQAEQLRSAARPPGPADVEGYYRAHQEDFGLPARRECAHIVAPSREAADVVARSLASGEPFERAARHMSTEAATAAKGGSMGVVSFDQLRQLEKAEPAAARAMRDARPGEVAGPVQSSRGWHLFRCGPIAPAGAAPLEAVAEGVRARLLAEARDQALRDGLAGLKSKARISVDEVALRRLADAR